MQAYQKEMIALSLETGALQFGDFTLKSGRQSPYFFNAGAFNTGKTLARLGGVYADAFAAAGFAVEGVFGPAYKGIPLVSAMSCALAQSHDIDLPYSFNRKEAKDHGEGGMIVGASLSGRIAIVDDLITAGTAIRESIEIIKRAGAQVGGILVALDRQEKGVDARSAIQALAEEQQVPVIAVITLTDIFEYVAADEALRQWQQPIEAYRAEYGVIG